jgi:hypothetical protein
MFWGVFNAQRTKPVREEQHGHVGLQRAKQQSGSHCRYSYQYQAREVADQRVFGRSYQPNDQAGRTSKEQKRVPDTPVQTAVPP